jgi:predicted Zn-dependent protease
MNKIWRICLAIILGICIIGMVFDSCSTVPITGRRQLSLIPQSEMMSLSLTQYTDFLKSNKVVPATDKRAIMVKTVGKKIQTAVEGYYRQKNLSLSGYNWEFNLVESTQVNAWCMPGGKVVVYTGILPVTMNDTGLAVVLSHEISHAIAGHGEERMSHELIAQFGSAALSEAISQKPEETKQLWMGVFGAGVQYGALLPFSRLQESEADHLGLIFMAMAGYDPNEALTFWQRMAQQSQGKANPEFMNTHPSDQTRIATIRKELPEALQYYTKPKTGK